MAVELLDELEAGELSVEFEGEEPDAVLEWAIERFSPRIAISTAFQIDGVVVLDMAYAIDPDIRVFSVDTGRMPQETFDLIERLLERYSGLNLELLAPNPTHLQRMVARKGPNLFYESVENRLLCCNVRKVQPLTRHLKFLEGESRGYVLLDVGPERLQADWYLVPTVTERTDRETRAASFVCERGSGRIVEQ